ncbi:MAG: hypothetical protein QNK03_02005 [Myxococcota bacterium]|nr:hypothetical protein [Myxococcota bacterium]
MPARRRSSRSPSASSGRSEGWSAWTTKQHAYQQKAEAELEEQLARLAQVKARLKKRLAEGRIEAHEQIEDVERRLRSVRDQLADLASAGEDVVGEIRGTVERLSADVSRTVRRILGSEDDDESKRDP